MKRSALHIVIFSFGVIMILLRPFMAYEVSSRPDFAKDPQKVFSLLQRLIKKKDNHQDYTENEAAEPRRHRTNFALQPRILNHFLGSLTSFNEQAVNFNGHVPIPEKLFALPGRLKLLSRFQI